MPRKFNILFLFTDDQRFDTIGALGTLSKQKLILEGFLK